MSRPPTLQCQDRSGFLFSHPCDRLATGQCTTCGKAICVEHTRLTDTGPRCVTCLRTEAQHDDDDDGTYRARWSSSDTAEAARPATPAAPAREGAFGGGGASETWSAEEAMASGGDPHFFGGPAAWQGQYDAEDYAAFEPPAAASESAESGIESDTGAS
jgi:hypothetical protein